MGYYDVQVYDYNTWSWLTLNDGFYVKIKNPSFTISPDGEQRDEMFISVEIIVLSLQIIVEHILRFNGYSNTFYGNTYGWDSGSNYKADHLNYSILGNKVYDVQVYDYNN